MLDGCIECVKGFAPSPDGKQCFKEILKCTAYTSTGNCSVCEENYFSNNISCLKTIDNCLNYNLVNGLCLECKTEFMITANN